MLLQIMHQIMNPSVDGSVAVLSTLICPLSSTKSLSESRYKPSHQHTATFRIKSNSVSTSSPSELRKQNLNALNNFVKVTQVTGRSGV